MKMNPMLNKEMKLSVRTPRLTVLIVVYNSLLLLFGAAAVWSIRYLGKIRNSINFRLNIYLYIMMIAIAFVLLMLIIPTITAGLISGEREKQTLDILLTSGLRPCQIISGKLFGAVGNILLLLFSGLPVLGLTFIYGGVGFSDFLVSLLCLIFSAFYIGSIGIFCSSLFKRTTFASLLSYAIEICLVVGPFLAVSVIQAVCQIHSGYTSSDVGGFCILLFLSPGFTLAYILLGRVASLANVDLWLIRLGMPQFLSDHFVIISLAVQCLVICLFTGLAVYKLKDREHRRRKRGMVKR